MIDCTAINLTSYNLAAIILIMDLVFTLIILFWKRAPDLNGWVFIALVLVGIIIGIIVIVVGPMDCNNHYLSDKKQEIEKIQSMTCSQLQSYNVSILLNKTSDYVDAITIADKLYTVECLK